MAALIRKTYFPNPYPNKFYSGNTVPEINVGIRENYYAWEWGNALFIVLDPYMYTKSKPEWGWTLGLQQYTWLKNTLSISGSDFANLGSSGKDLNIAIIEKLLEYTECIIVKE
jgi:hypothetical protein